MKKVFLISLIFFIGLNCGSGKGTSNNNSEITGSEIDVFSPDSFIDAGNDILPDEDYQEDELISNDGMAADSSDGSEAKDDMSVNDDGAEFKDTDAKDSKEEITPVCLKPVLPDSCLKEAVECTGLSTCGPTVVDCFQFGNDYKVQALPIVDQYMISSAMGSPTFSASYDTMKIDYSNGSMMLSQFDKNPRTIYFDPDGKICAVLDFHYEENSGNWGDYDIFRRYYLRYGEGKLITVYPLFKASPSAWWKIEGYEVRCNDGKTEKWTFDEFKPFAYLFYGGENQNGKSFLPYWTADGCKSGEFSEECIYSENMEKREWCDGNNLHICKKGVNLTVNCSAYNKFCVKIPIVYGGETYDYHAFCAGSDSCSQTQCDGDKIAECWGGYIEYKDCSEVKGKCISNPGYMPYTPPSAICASISSNKCDPATFPKYLHCEGSEVVSCYDYYSIENRFDCSLSGMKCVEYTQNNESYAYCHPSQEPEKCSDKDNKCDGDVRIYCNGGYLIQEDCKKRFGKTCKIGISWKENSEIDFPYCVDEDSKSCTNTAINCAGCEGDKRVFCGGGLTLFDDCSHQGLEATNNEGRTCYAGKNTSDSLSYCPYCGQKGAKECSYADFKPYCENDSILKCYADHEIELDCIESFPQYASGWCNVDQWGNAYCETAPQCKIEETPPECEKNPLSSANCESGALVKHDCYKEGFQDCKINKDNVAVCIQADAQACEKASFKPYCEGDSVVHCPSGFTFISNCGSGMTCGINQDGNAVCHQSGAEQCMEFLFDYKCDGDIAVSCQDGFVKKTDCPKACPNCICKSADYQAWCEPGMP
jgi:hypothetical protein